MPKKTIAIKYEFGDIAPKVLTKGKGVLADKILDIAKKIVFLFIKMKNWLMLLSLFLLLHIFQLSYIIL